MSKYQVQQSVIILEQGTGKILASGKIVSYESIRDEYRVSYQLGDDPTIWYDDVKEDRLTTWGEVGVRFANVRPENDI